MSKSLETIIYDITGEREPNIMSIPSDMWHEIGEEVFRIGTDEAKEEYKELTEIYENSDMDDELQDDEVVDYEWYKRIRKNNKRKI